ncbi:MAG TPA: (2Fe-2S)-binding protein [Burkholderiaceae bacterium]
METTRFTVNGAQHAVQADPKTPLLDVLRDEIGLKGARFGCGAGECGACHVLIDGVSQASCNLPLWAVQGRAIITVEGLPPALAAAFVAEQALQCGYCGSGVLVGAAVLLQRQPQPTEADVRSALDGHLCRCGAHNRIVRAVLRAAQSLQ